MSELSFEIDNVLSKYVTKPEENVYPEELLFYGQPGSGKSYLAASAINIKTPDLSFKKGLIIDVEGSTVGVVDDPRIDIIRIDKYEHVKKDGSVDPYGKFLFLNTILSDDPKSGLFYPDNKTSYDFIIIDTLDVAQDLAIEYYTSGVVSSLRNKGGEVDGFKVWAKVADWTLSVARGLKKIDPLGILVLHDREEKLNSGAFTKRLRLSGSAKDTLAGVPDVVAYLERSNSDKGPVTTSYFSTEDNKVSKNRYGKYNIPPIAEGVDLNWFYNKIYEGRKESEGKK